MCVDNPNSYRINFVFPQKEQELTYDDADCNEMEDSEPAADADDPNNEVEIIDDSSEVPNQSGSSSSVSAAPEQSGVGGSNGEGRGSERETSGSTSGAQIQVGASQSEAISSGSEGMKHIYLNCLVIFTFLSRFNKLERKFCSLLFALNINLIIIFFKL